MNWKTLAHSTFLARADIRHGFGERKTAGSTSGSVTDADFRDRKLRAGIRASLAMSVNSKR